MKRTALLMKQTAQLMKRTALFILLCLSFSAAACAAESSGGAPGALAGLLQGTVFPFVTSVFMAIVSVFLDRLGRKYQIETLTKRNNILEQLAFQGITLAEETAARMLKSRVSLTGREKLDMAIGHVCAAMPKVSREQAEAVVNALLAQTPGVGALKGTAIGGVPGRLPEE